MRAPIRCTAAVVVVLIPATAWAVPPDSDGAETEAAPAAAPSGRWRAMSAELRPYYSFDANGSDVKHGGPGVALQFYPLEWLGFGGSYESYDANATDQAPVTKATRIGEPLVGYDHAWSFDATLVPFSARPEQTLLFGYDAYVSLGLGAVAVQNAAVVDPDNRRFPKQTHLAGSAGVGLRLYFRRWLALGVELRDQMFRHAAENDQIASAPSGLQDPATWYGPEQTVNDVRAEVGLSFLVPGSGFP